MKTLFVKQKNPERLPEGQTFPESFFFNSASAVLVLKLGLEALVALGWCPVLARGAVKTYLCRLCLKTVPETKQPQPFSLVGRERGWGAASID